MTRSSILRIILTTSVANFSAEIVTKEGCITFSISISEIIPFLTLIPAFFSPNLCLFLSSVTISTGFNPAFSAKVYGITSKASANPLKQ